MVLSTNLHCVLYPLLRCEALRLPVGPLDVNLTNPIRPFSLTSQLAVDKCAVAISNRLSSAMSAMSQLSLGADTWDLAPVDA